MNDKVSVAEQLAGCIAEAGGRAYYVGGYVRDRILGLVGADVDIEVYGLPKEQLVHTIDGMGRIETKGADYGIFSLPDYGIDLALPRTEVRTGTGHRDFVVSTDPWLTPEVACRRRDFTINAMLMDVLTGDIVDPYDGLGDIERKSIRHIDAGIFSEDPLRVLRACQFSARLGYGIDPKTIRVCSSMDISTLQGARVADEMRKALLLSDNPSAFFENLRLMGHLGYWFPELEKLVGLEQDPKYHPEGDVWIHTMQVLDRAAAVRNKSGDGLSFMLLALTHDFGKALTTQRVGDRIHSLRHETMGIPSILEFLNRLSFDKKTIRYVSQMVPLHMKPGRAVHDRSSIKATNTMFDLAADPMDLALFYEVDRGFDPEGMAFLMERLDIYREIMSRPYVTGDDLIKAGFSPSDEFSRRLDLARKLRLAGVDRETALKQVTKQKI